MRRLSAGHVVVASLMVSVAVPAPLGPGFGAAERAAARGAWTEADLWLAPGPASTPVLGSAVAALDDGDRSLALAIFSRAASHPIVGGYARLYQGRTELALDNPDLAVSSARQVLASAPGPTLREQALWLLADALEKTSRWDESVTALRTLVELPSRNLPRAYLRLGRAAFKADEKVTAAEAFTTLYYDFPLSPEAGDAEDELTSHFHVPPASMAFERSDRRAEALYVGRRFDAARKAFAALAVSAPAVARDRIRLRLAQCDVQLGRYAQARRALQAYLDTADERLDEAGYAYLTAVRGLRRAAEYQDRVGTFVTAYPRSPLAEAALNDLATYHVLADHDAEALATFRQVLERYPRGAFAERAAWKVGWGAFRNGDYQETIARFEQAAVTFPRSDYRPSWLYWAARAHERLGHMDSAVAGYRQTLAAYRNSYYGRRAAEALSAQTAVVARRTTGPHAALAETAEPTGVRIDPATPPDNAPLIRALLAAELYDDAVLEIRRAQTERPSSLLDATLAYALNRKGQLRAGIIAMRRAYPQFIAEGGEALPVGLLRVIYPVDYWDLIRHYAGQHDLDPYLLAALIAQESTFQADIKSHANAWGLMQILPSTGRRVAASAGVRGFSTWKLTDPDVNLRIGTKYFQDLLARFDGDPAPALAAYNAGESRVRRWLAERPGIGRDEFIDDIPFPETQNYVKRILGTAEDYRMLYAASGGAVVRTYSR